MLEEERHSGYYFPFASFVLERSYLYERNICPQSDIRFVVLRSLIWFCMNAGSSSLSLPVCTV